MTDSARHAVALSRDVDETIMRRTQQSRTRRYREDEQEQEQLFSFFLVSSLFVFSFVSLFFSPARSTKLEADHSQASFPRPTAGDDSRLLDPDRSVWAHTNIRHVCQQASTLFFFSLFPDHSESLLRAHAAASVLLTHCPN
jgi:hypothetical protein